MPTLGTDASLGRLAFVREVGVCGVTVRVGWPTLGAVGLDASLGHGRQPWLRTPALATDANLGYGCQPWPRMPTLATDANLGRLAFVREVGVRSGGWRLARTVASVREVGVRSGGWRLPADPAFEQYFPLSIRIYGVRKNSKDHLLTNRN